MNALIVEYVRRYIQRARYAKDTRQWGLWRTTLRTIRRLFKLRHSTTSTAIRMLTA